MEISFLPPLDRRDWYHRMTREKRKVCVVIASRANYARIKSAMLAIQEHPELELQLVVAASALLERFGTAIKVIRQDGFEPNATAYFVIEGENPTTMAKSTGLATIELATVFDQLKPDVVLTVADRHETMATAVAASYMNICLAHTQGGEITGSIDESVRHAVTKLAHIHFAATKEARERILRMGENPDSVFLTGCPAVDLAALVDKRIDFDPFERYGGVGPKFPLDGRFLLVVQHPVTTEYGQGRAQIQETLQAIYDLRIPTIWLWPNVDAGSDEISKGIRVFREHHTIEHIHFFKNFSPEDYIKLLSNCAVIVGNSSSGIREAAFLGVPAVNIGTRQQGRQRGKNVIDVPYDKESIKWGVMRQLANGRFAPDYTYGDGKAGQRIAEILAVHRPPIQKRFYVSP